MSAILRVLPSLASGILRATTSSGGFIGRGLSRTAQVASYIPTNVVGQAYQAGRPQTQTNRFGIKS